MITSRALPGIFETQGFAPSRLAVSRRLAIVGLEDEEKAGRRVGALASFAGAEPDDWRWVSADSGGAASAALFGSGEEAVIISARALRLMHSAMPGLDSITRNGAPRTRYLAVCGFDGSPAESDFFRQFTGGRLLGAKPIGQSGAVCEVNPYSRKICGSLAGLGFPVVDARNLLGFKLAESAEGAETLMSVAGEPVFVRLSTPSATILLVGTSEVPDLDRFVAPKQSIVSDFFSVVPWLACVRHLLGEKAWANDSPRACFIIDDPLLRKHYGHLSFERLVDCLLVNRACLSIAFIPWNFQRTDPDVAGLFIRHRDRLSLSVHGCDHTGGEFGLTDAKWTRAAAATALERMAEHQRRSGVPFDKVMIFPQGVFSVAAMAGLKASGYLAAVNTSPFPIDAGREALSLRELMEVAVTRFGDLALFVRRYPRHMADLAFDLFLGKPALVVEHHGFFRNGCDALAEVAEELGAIEPRLKWANLQNICLRACVKKRVDKGELRVRFHTDRFCWVNAGNHAETCVFQRRTTGDRIGGVTVNGASVAYEQTAREVLVPLVVDAGAAVEINIEPAVKARPVQGLKQGRMKRARILARRRLCEFRDNYVDKSPWLSRMAASVRSCVAPKR